MAKSCPRARRTTGPTAESRKCSAETAPARRRPEGGGCGGRRRGAAVPLPAPEHRPTHKRAQASARRPEVFRSACVDRSRVSSQRPRPGTGEHTRTHDTQPADATQTDDRPTQGTHSTQAAHGIDGSWGSRRGTENRLYMCVSVFTIHFSLYISIYLYTSKCLCISVSQSILLKVNKSCMSAGGKAPFSRSAESRSSSR